MAKKIKQPSPEAKARQLAKIEAKLEAEKLEKIRDNAFMKAQRAAIRAQARVDGFKAGLKKQGKKRR